MFHVKHLYKKLKKAKIKTLDTNKPRKKRPKGHPFFLETI